MGGDENEDNDKRHHAGREGEDGARDGFQAMNEMVKDNKEEGVFQMSKTEIILRDELTQLGEEQIAMRKVRDKLR